MRKIFFALAIILVSSFAHADLRFSASSLTTDSTVTAPLFTADCFMLDQANQDVQICRNSAAFAEVEDSGGSPALLLTKGYESLITDSDLTAMNFASGYNLFKATLTPSASDAGFVTTVYVDTNTTGNTHNITGGITGLNASTTHNGTGTLNSGIALGAAAAQLSASAQTKNFGIQSFAYSNGAGTVTTQEGLDIQTGTFDGTITNNYGIKIAAPFTVASLVNNYGIYLGDQSGAGTLSYAIFTEGAAPSSFGGDVNVNGILTFDAGLGTSDGDGGMNLTALRTVSVILTPQVSAPVCGAPTEGAMYADTSHALCYCDGTSWIKVGGAGTCS